MPECSERGQALKNIMEDEKDDEERSWNHKPQRGRVAWRIWRDSPVEARFVPGDFVGHRLQVIQVEGHDHIQFIGVSRDVGPADDYFGASRAQVAE